MSGRGTIRTFLGATEAFVNLDYDPCLPCPPWSRFLRAASGGVH